VWLVDYVRSIKYVKLDIYNVLADGQIYLLDNAKRLNTSEDMGRIKKMCVTGDHLMVLTEDGKLWANGQKPTHHFAASRNESSHYYQLDISEQFKQCDPTSQVLDISSTYECTFLLMGKKYRNTLDLMKIWKQEAFVDVIIL
jgi:alpha-tubulin suppressor-like RCC1 family protein